MSDASAKAHVERPNVLWICTDQQRFDTIRALGNGRINTPNLDRLVEGGVTLTRAFSQSPVCTPSRAAFLTGRYPRTTGCRQNGQAIPARERLITRMLADVGYACGLSGKLHLSSCAGGRVEQRIDDGYAEFHWSHHPQPDWPENAYTQWLASRGRSWDELYTGPATPYVKHGVPAEYHQTTWCAERAVEFIRRNRDRPWLFSFNCFDPHHPFDPPAEYLERYRPEDMPLPKFRPGELDNKPDYQKLDHEWAHNEPGYFHVGGMTDDDRRQVTAAYYAMVELIDAQVGRMLAALEETGQLATTIVLFMSDHGEMLGDHGIYLKGPHFYDEAVRVPLVLSWPGRFRAGLRADALVELVDLAPTLLEAAGLDVPAAMQGRSLLPLLTGEADPSVHRDAVYSEYYNAWTHKHSYGTMLRTRHEKIVVYHGVDQGELYDLDEDPDEFDNLWDRPDRAAMKMRLLKQAFDASVLAMDPMPPRLGAF
ncbi:MAG TPA: sulfatase-like hydrolase/transferase [Thermoguttaceae bacterium]|nr:sulfatase-like hydrolase/transferase [Thermoguttaceae bacterium]